jgi:hypothetical protein
MLTADNSVDPIENVQQSISAQRNNVVGTTTTPVTNARASHQNLNVSTSPVRCTNSSCGKIATASK